MLFIEEYKSSEESIEFDYKFIMETYEKIRELLNNVNQKNIGELERKIDFLESNMSTFLMSHSLLLQEMWDEIYSLNNRNTEMIVEIDKKAELEKIFKLHKEKERKDERLKLYESYQKKFDNLLKDVKKIEIEKEKIKDKLIKEKYISNRGIFSEACENETWKNELEDIKQAEKDLIEEFQKEIEK